MKVDSNKRKIVFEKFDCLDKEEVLVARKIVEKYAQKIEKITEIEQIKLELKAHSKVKVNNFEVKGHIDYKQGTAMSEQQDINPFVAIDIVMEKMFQEIKHKIDRK
jgi:ribosome-associated translation inhibitor RaiA